MVYLLEAKMNEMNLIYVKEHHRNLVRIAQQEHLLKSLREHNPGLLDHALLGAGNLLVAWGERLRRGSAITQGKMSGECV
jgi:hypothetical protein